MTDLLKLAERVEAGECDLDFCQKTLWEALGCGPINLLLHCALQDGSLNAAKSLHAAVLPGWEWGIEYDDEEQCAYVRKDTLHIGHSSNPATAWVAAILRAKHAEEST